MLHTPKSRLIVITSILIVLTAIAVSANWGIVSGFSLFTANDAAPETAATDESAGDRVPDGLSASDWDGIRTAYEAGRSSSIGSISQEAYLKPAAVGTTQLGDLFGDTTVAVSGDTVVIGARNEDSSTTGVNSTPVESATDAGAAYVFVRSGGVWTQQGYLKPAAVGTTQAGDQFGWSVAVAGDTVVVGAFGEDSSTTGVNSTPNDDGTANSSGAAYIFTRSAGVWTQQAYLKPGAVGTTQAGDNFGGSVAVAGDTVVVGAPQEASSSTGVNSTPNDDGTANSSGAAYIFTRSAGVWTQQAYLKPGAVGTTQAGDLFGRSVAVAGDTVVVGAIGEGSDTTGVNSTPNESAAGSGAAYVFTHTAGVWTQEAYLKPAAVGTTQAGDSFGQSVAVSGDTVVVGAHSEDSNTMGVNSTPDESTTSAGAAYVFTRSAGVWAQQAYLKPAAVGTTQAGDFFGFSVAVAGDTVAVGALAEDSSTTGVNSTANESANQSGAAYVFIRNAGLWTQQAYLKPAAVGTTQANDNFGISVAVSGDTVVVGAGGEDSSTTGVNSTPNEGSNDSGAAYVIAGLGSTPTPTSTPTDTPTNTPTNTSTPTNTPTDTPTDTPTNTPTPTPTIMPFGSNCYQFVEVTDPFTGSNNSWFAAKAAAEASVFNSVNGHLATVTSLAENSFLLSLVTGNPTGFKGAWLGGKHPEGWLDGPENGMAFSYTNWTGLEPNNAGYAYMSIGSGGSASGLWLDDSGVQGFPDPTFDPVIGYFVEYENACTSATPTDTPTNTPTNTPTPSVNGPISPLYLSGIEFGSGPNVQRFKVFQSGSVINAWNGVGNDPEVYMSAEVTIAVSSSIKSLGGSCAGACDPNRTYVAEYTLAGAFVGSSTVSGVPQSSPGHHDYLYDGTTDGTNNYALGTLTRNVYSFDSNWGNAVTLFTLPALPSSGLWLGITYDPGNNSLWVSGHNWSVVKNYSMDGTLLSEFMLDGSFGGLATGLALDPADQTLWIGRTFSSSPYWTRIEQYSKQGAFLGWTSATELQYFEILGAEFPITGPFPTATPTDTPTNTPTPADTPSIAGTVTYGNAIGNPVPPRFVKDVSVASTDGSPAVGPVITGTPGTYTLSGFGAGSYTIKPTKPGGSNGAITSNDAARVAQGVSSSVPFVSLNQKFASDASGNGTVSSNDAALIARFAAGLTGTGNVGQWKFFTANLPGPPTAPLPTPPYNDSRTYASVTSNATGEDYIALLIGEASGNYNPATHPRGTGAGGRMSDVSEDSEAAAKPITVTVEPVVTAADKEILVPVSVEGVTGREIISYEFDLRYDPAVIQPLENVVDVSGTVSRGLMVVTNANEPGLLRVVVYGPMPIVDDGILLNLRFTAVGAVGSVSPLTFERIMFNDGESRVSVSGGQVELF